MMQLRGLPLVVQDVEWIPEAVRTGGINGPLHHEWDVAFRLWSPEENIRAAVYVESGGVRIFDKETLRRSTQQVDLRLRFGPWDWSSSDAFWIGTSHPTGFRVEDPMLKVDLRAAITLAVAPGIVVRTGQPVPLLYHPSSGTTLGIVAVCTSDTKVDRMRWRLKEPAGGAVSAHRYLNSGRAAGEESCA